MYNVHETTTSVMLRYDRSISVYHTKAFYWLVDSSVQTSTREKISYLITYTSFRTYKGQKKTKLIERKGREVKQGGGKQREGNKREGNGTAREEKTARDRERPRDGAHLYDKEIDVTCSRRPG